MSAAPASMELFRAAVDRRFHPRALAALGGVPDARIVGFLDPGFPRELAMAAGYLPLLITADPHGATATADPFLDLGAPARIRRLSDALITGVLDDIDLLCVTGGDRWLADLGGFLEAYRDLTDLPGAEVIYFERARGTTPAHLKFNREQIVTLRDRWAVSAGHAIDDTAVGEAIALTNTTRELLARLVALRQGAVPAVSGVDANTISLAALLLPAALFNEHLREFLDAAEAPDAGRPRVFVSGSSLDHLGLYELIEAAGATVVGEDTAFGQRCGGEAIDVTIDPIAALADHHTFGFPEPWAFGREARIAQKVDAAVRAGADGEIFFHVAHDSSIGWDFPDQRAALQQRGIAVLALVDQDDAVSQSGDVVTAVRGFIAALGVPA